MSLFKAILISAFGTLIAVVIGGSIKNFVNSERCCPATEYYIEHRGFEKFVVKRVKTTKRCKQKVKVLCPTHTFRDWVSGSGCGYSFYGHKVFKSELRARRALAKEEGNDVEYIFLSKEEFDAIKAFELEKEKAILPQRK